MNLKDVVTMTCLFLSFTSTKFYKLTNCINVDFCPLLYDQDKIINVILYKILHVSTEFYFILNAHHLWLLNQRGNFLFDIKYPVI